MRRGRGGAVAAVALMLWGCAPVASAPAGPEPANRWWRGNLHTHTLWSDGNGPPLVVAEWYRSHGYDFVVMTDHNSVQERVPGDTLHADLPTFSEYVPGVETPGEFLVVQGQELSDLFDGKPLHVTVFNTAEVIPPQGGATVAEALQRDLNAVRETAARTERTMVAGVNHPNFFWVASAADLADLDGLQLFEVYNGSFRVNNEGDETRPGTEAMWDQILTARARAGRPPVWGTAVDDAHQFKRLSRKLTTPGRGWVMVHAESLTADDLAAAVARGDFYASTGVSLDGVRREGEELIVEIAAEPGLEYETYFVGTRGAGEPGELLASVRGPVARYRLQGDELYVRARVVSSRIKPNGYEPDERERAWTQPWLPAR